MVFVVDILEDMYDNFWIGIFNSGVFCFNIWNGYWKYFQYERNDLIIIINNFVIILFEDLKGIMWVGINGGGFCLFDLKIEIFIDFDLDNIILFNWVIYFIE